MGGLVGNGVATGALEYISTDIAPCGATIKDTGVESGLIGICGDEIITIARGGGFGAVTGASGGTCIACEFSDVGMVVTGAMSAAIGTCTVAITIIIRTMAGPSGVGVASDALESTCTACEHCGVTTKVIGAVFALIGTSTEGIITTNELDGSGEAIAGSDIIYTVSASSNAGLVLGGLLSAGIGTCGVAITIVIDCMAAPAGYGVGSDAWVTTSTAFGSCSATTMGIGAGSALIGECGSATNIIAQTAGLGEPHVALADTCTVSESSIAGLDLVGLSSAGTGACIVEITTITTFTEGTAGHGAGTGALVCTFTACEPSTGTTRATGAGCVRTGTSGGETTTTSVRAGSGRVTTKGLAVISTDGEHTRGGQELDGTQFAATGSCTAAITTTIDITEELVGRGAATAALVYICTVAEPCGGTTKVTGVASVLTGTCGDVTTITGDPDGSGARAGASGTTSTACASSGVGMEGNGSGCELTGI